MFACNLAVTRFGDEEIFFRNLGLVLLWFPKIQMPYIVVFFFVTYPAITSDLEIHRTHCRSGQTDMVHNQLQDDMLYVWLRNN